MLRTREEEVLAQLDRVTDPELDEPVTELGFVTAVAAGEDGVVSVAFRLPTYWCADMRREVGRLPWVTEVVPQLGEHMYAEQINRGVAAGLSFHETFGDAAVDDLDVVRRTFLLKAFQRRQEALLQHLLDAGLAAEALAGLTLDGLSGLTLGQAGVRLRDRYMERRSVAGPADADALAFVDAGGRALAATDLPAHLRSLRRVGTNAEFNGALCSALLAARFGVDRPSGDGEPTLLDFARMGPARQGASVLP